jgi:hypothetical protein
VTWDTSVSHKVEVATVAGFAASRLGTDPAAGLSVPDWLMLTGQSVLEVTAGPVFTDQTRELAPVRAMLAWYPADVERYVLACGWEKIAQQLPMAGRIACRGDELGSRLLSVRLSGDLMWLAFALSRRWPPYAKWRGTIFRALPVAAGLAAPLTAAATAPDWQEREDSLASACETLLDTQRARGLPAPAVAVTPFWDRPYRTIDPAIAHGLLAEVTDPRIAKLPRGIGSVEQWVDNVDVLAHPERRQALRASYQRWASPG